MQWEGRIPLNHRQGSFKLSVIAVGMYFWVAVTCSLTRLQLAGHVQKVCKEFSGAVPHLGHRASVLFKIAMRDRGHVAPDIIVSRAHLRGYCSGDLCALIVLRVASQSIPRSIPLPLKWWRALSKSNLMKNDATCFEKLCTETLKSSSTQNSPSGSCQQLKE